MPLRHSLGRLVREGAGKRKRVFACLRRRAGKCDAFCVQESERSIEVMPGRAGSSRAKTAYSDSSFRTRLVREVGRERTVMGKDGRGNGETGEELSLSGAAPSDSSELVNQARSLRSALDAGIDSSQPATH